jgi:N-acetylmuramoyl-L-alanine amidase
MKKVIVLLAFLTIPFNVGAMTQVEKTERKCLTHNIYFESRGQSNECQKLVGFVTLNRVLSNRYPNTICEVVYQNRQFSWTQDGKPDTPNNTKSLKRAGMNADYVLSNYFKDKSNGALFYHADYVAPRWAKRMKITKKCGEHIFYKD